MLAGCCAALGLLASAAAAQAPKPSDAPKAPDASPPATLPGDSPALAARRALLAEDFTAARKALAAVPDGTLRASLTAAADEIELDAVCDTAQKSMDGADFAGALELLAPAMQRLGGAKAAMLRARGLHAIASVRVDELTGETAQFLAQLRAAMAAGDASLDRFEKLRKEALDRIDKALAEMATLAKTAETAGALYQTTNCLAALDGLKQRSPQIAALVTALETKLDAPDWIKLDERVKSGVLAALDRATLAAASLQYFQRNFDAARKLFDEGLARSPLNREMIRLRAKIDDWDTRRNG